jgi:hypothetical protein
MAYIIAPALETLRLQLNKAFPKRSKASDGGIGDAGHASRSSDHNPWVKGKKGVGVVTARDFTHDPRTGIDCEWLADTLVANRDPRIKYIIWNRQICSSKQSPWKWRKYTGANAHTKHLHLSVNAEEKFWNDKTPWDLDFPNDKTDDVAKLKDSATDLPSDSNQSGESTRKTADTESTSASINAAHDQSSNKSDQAIEAKQTEQTAAGELELQTKNEQKVTEPARIASPEPYMGVGFWGVIKRDLAAATGGNLTFSSLAEYAQQASGWPDWVVGILSKLAIGLLIATFGYFMFRLVHYGVDTWKKSHKTRTEALVNTDVTRKDIEWVEPGTPVAVPDKTEATI